MIHKTNALSNWAINNKATVLVITAIIFIAGITSYKSMPNEAFPEVIMPEIFITTIYPGNSSLDIEKLITRPLEKEINQITGVDKITSTSKQGFSTINVKFSFDITPEQALQKVKDKVDIAKADKDFPNDLPADPAIREFNMSEMMPIMNVNLTGEFSLDQLKEYGEFLENEIEKLSEISGVDIRGIQEKEVEIAVDLNKMESLELNFNDLAEAIRNENMTLSSGDIKQSGLLRNVRVVGEYKDPTKIENIIVKNENQKVVYLRDIATVLYKEQEKKSYAREFSKPVVMLDVKKRSGKNLIVASRKIDEFIKKAKKDKLLPKKLIISKTNDQTNKTISQVTDLENNIIFGVLLVVLILMFFLGLRNSLFVGVAIPLSMLLSFVLLNALGITLNMMVLFGLVLALGMLVDNGIVVVENIYRYIDEGYSNTEAAKYGVGEVAWPIIASTATTLAAFIPLGFWPGVMGQFMKYFPLTLIMVLASSLFVALVINPVLTSMYMKVEKTKTPFKKVLIRSAFLGFIGVLFLLIGFKSTTKVFIGIGNLLLVFSILNLLFSLVINKVINWFQNKFLPRLEKGYEKILRFSLKGRNAYITFIITFLMLIFSFILMGIFPPKTLFFPESDPEQIFVYSEFPIGTTIEKTNVLTHKLEIKIQDYLKQYEKDGKSYLIKSVIGQVGEGTGDPEQGNQGNTPNKSRISLDFVQFVDRRGVNTSDVLTDLRNLLVGYPGVNITIAKNQNGPPAGPPLNIEVSGENYDELIKNTIAIKDFIVSKNISGIEELKLDVELGKPEMILRVDRQKANRLGVSTGQIADVLRTALYGKEISTFKDGEDNYPINIRLQEKYRYNKEALLNQKIIFRDQASGRIKKVPIAAITTTKNSTTFSAVKRKNLNRVISIYTNILEGYNPTEVVKNTEQILKSYKLPTGYSYKFTGEQEEQEKMMAFLSKALLIGVVLIFLILVAQFNSATTPIIISLSVLLSLIGVLLGLIIFNMDFIILMTMLGIISLAGIVVNNAIVLIDYVNLILERKKATLKVSTDKLLPKKIIYESIVQAGKVRLRPVILTAITTILGMIPLAFGININFVTLFTEYDSHFYIGGENVMFWGPLSKTVIFGLVFATFLTLIIVPVMYYILFRVQLRLNKNNIAKV
ncbi:MAG: efflux RND transporter permease subunit [Flavobacteriaceae bacterium]|nr:efflux RND transporter permease subunit [Flavobacteriaceae bacterium]